MAAKKKNQNKKPKGSKFAVKGKPKSKPRSKAPAKSAKKASSPASKKKKSTRVVRKAKRPALRSKVKAKAKRIVVKPVVQPNEEALRLARMVASVANDKKAQDVMILDTRRRGASVGYDYVVLATADSDRQLEALADSARDAAKVKGRAASGIESSPDWVLVNFDDVVVHFFTPDKRVAYDIEGLWADAPRVAVEA